MTTEVLKITTHFVLPYQDRLYATEVTTHTGQNNHLFFAVIYIYDVDQMLNVELVIRNYFHSILYLLL